MLEAALAALAIASAGGALWLWGLMQRARARSWQAAAYSAGLVELTAARPFAPGQALTGRSGSLGVRIESFRREDERQRIDTRVVVEDLEHRLFGVTLRREDALTRLFGPKEIEIGDPVFDEAFFIGGTPSLVHAFLDTETRAVLYRMNELGALEITSTEVRLDIFASYRALPLANAIRLLLEVTERLRDRANTATRLAANARHDQWPARRLQNLLCLIREFAGHPIVPETLRAACEDRDPEVRLRAAKALGSDGLETLLAMTEDLSIADVWQAAAVSALGRSVPIDRARQTLERALRTRHLETARACVDALRFGGQAAVEPLLKALTEETGLVAAAAARVLGSLRTPAAEASLVQALSRNTPGLCIAAAEALGHSGSAAAVLPLKEAAGRDRDAAFRRAVRQAIAEIQARLPGASPGQLSLAATEAGQLSLATDEAGRLSLAEDPQGQLSLAESRQARRRRT